MAESDAPLTDVAHVVLCPICEDPVPMDVVRIERTAGWSAVTTVYRTQGPHVHGRGGLLADDSGGESS